MTEMENLVLEQLDAIRNELAELNIKAAIESLDARLRVLEEERRTLNEGILKMREEGPTSAS